MAAGTSYKPPLGLDIMCLDQPYVYHQGWVLPLKVVGSVTVERT